MLFVSCGNREHRMRSWVLVVLCTACALAAESETCEASVPGDLSCADAVFVTMGETMIRFQPMDTGRPPDTPTRHLPQPFLRSLGGDELNVAVALSLLGVTTRWISVLPLGPMGDVVAESCKHHGVEFAGARVEGEIGTFTVLPEEKMVHYQRRQSAFALHDPNALECALLHAPCLHSAVAPDPWRCT